MVLKNKCEIAIFLLLIIFTSCKKILIVDAASSPISENAWQSPADVQREVAAAYALLRDAITAPGYTNILFAAGDIRSGDFSNESPSLSDWNSRTNTKKSLQKISDWRAFYTAIAQYNLILDRINDIPDRDWKTGEKNHLLGETRFLRGYTFFLMACLWREFPLPLHSMNFENLPREKENKIFEVIYDDLSYASQHLTWSYSADEKTVRATKGASLAIMAHAKAWMHAYNEAEKYCDSVIRFGGYKLIEKKDELKNIFIGKSIEGIFEINFSYDQQELKKNATPASITMGKPYYTNSSVFSPPGYESNSEGIWDDVRTVLFPYDARQNDIRNDEWFMGWSVYEEDTTPWLGKFRYLHLGGDTTSYNINECNTIITRLADIILLHAEALEVLGRNKEAIEELNKIRKRANSDLYSINENLKNAILNERRIELCAEGHRFFDLVRTRQMPQFQRNINRADWYESNLWTLPIYEPYLAQSNFSLVQYPVWK